MVYYGVVSKGCQRCRQRKIKCDLRRPGCLRCEKSDTQCPGYRNLNEVLFRDESERIIRKAHQSEQPRLFLIRESLGACPKSPTTGASSSGSKSPASSFASISISYPPSQPINELGANFFFARYSSSDGPLFSDCHHWLTRSYLDDRRSHALQAAVEAVGMAGISNVFHAPHAASKSNEYYCRALTAMKQALNDPVQAVADTTLMAVILLGLFEIVNFETWDRYRGWVAHVKAATVLLELRGRDQFTRERGAQLYIQIRTQILSVCMQQHLPVHPVLVRATYDFQSSAVRQQWRYREIASPGSMCEISFRLVNLRAAIENGEATDPQAICEAALELDGDLETWRAGLPSRWTYATIDAREAAVGACLDGKTHVYPSLWSAASWNSWRMLRILVNQLIMWSEVRPGVSENAQEPTAVSVVRQLSTDLCISSSSLMGTPGIVSLIQPLYAVAMEEVNARDVRSFAIGQLRRIDASTGIRKARLLADSASKCLSGSVGDSASLLGCLIVPLKLSRKV